MNPFALICLVLICISAGSLFVEMTQPNQAVALTESDSEQKTSTIPAINVVNQDISALKNQPVFSQTRQPLIINNNAVNAGNQQDVVYELSGQYRLAGLVLTEEQALAVVVDQKADKTKKLAVNEKIDGWQLTTVEPTFAVFKKDQQQRRLALWREQEKTKSQPPIAEVTVPELIRVDASDGVFEEDPYQ